MNSLPFKKGSDKEQAGEDQPEVGEINARVALAKGKNPSLQIGTGLTADAVIEYNAYTHKRQYKVCNVSLVLHPSNLHRDLCETLQVQGQNVAIFLPFFYPENQPL